MSPNYSPDESISNLILNLASGYKELIFNINVVFSFANNINVSFMDATFPKFGVECPTRPVRNGSHDLKPVLV